jgi:hypothetical protein
MRFIIMLVLFGMSFPALAERDCSLNDKIQLHYYIERLAKTPADATKAYDSSVAKIDALADELKTPITLVSKNIDLQRSDASSTPFYTLEAELTYDFKAMDAGVAFMTEAHKRDIDVALSQNSRLPRGCSK